MEKLKGMKAYYISTLSISILVAFVAGIFSFITSWDLRWTLKSFFIFLPTIGYALDLLYKYTMRNNEFYFYYNLGLRKLELITYSFSISLIISYSLYKLTDVLWIV